MPRTRFSGEVHSLLFVRVVCSLPFEIPEMETHNQQQHIAPTKLFEVAKEGGEAYFTDEELKHIRQCVPCMERFRQFVRQLDQSRSKQAGTQ